MSYATNCYNVDMEENGSTPKPPASSPQPGMDVVAPKVAPDQAAATTASQTVPAQTNPANAAAVSQPAAPAALSQAPQKSEPPKAKLPATQSNVPRVAIAVAVAACIVLLVVAYMAYSKGT